MFEKFSKRARLAVVASQEEARDAGAEKITPVHLLLGSLDAGDTQLVRELETLGLTADAVRASDVGRVLTERDAAALKSVGIDVGAVADAVSERFGFDILRPVRKRFRAGNIPFGPGAKKALKSALQVAGNRRDRSITEAHVLLGILDCGDTEVRMAVASIVPVGTVQEQLNRFLDQPAA